MSRNPRPDQTGTTDRVTPERAVNRLSHPHSQVRGQRPAHFCPRKSASGSVKQPCLRMGVPNRFTSVGKRSMAGSGAGGRPVAVHRRPLARCGPARPQCRPPRARQRAGWPRGAQRAAWKPAFMNGARRQCVLEHVVISHSPRSGLSSAIFQEKLRARRVRAATGGPHAGAGGHGRP